MDVSQIVDTMFKLCAAMGMGYGLHRLKILNDGANASLSGLIINVTSPALVLYSVSRQSEVTLDVVRLFGFGVALYAALPLLAILFAWLLKPGAERVGVYQMLLVFANVSFMGFPVVQAMFGEQAIFYINILNIPFSLLIFTYGVGLLREKGGAMRPSLRMQDVLTPGFLSGVLSLLIYFGRIPMPSMIVSALDFIGGLTTPLSMIVIGSMVANFSLGQVFRDKKLLGLSAVKLLLFPALGFLIAPLIFPDPMLAGVVIISLGMPAGSLCAMVSRQYGTETQAGTAAMGVFATTVLSMITIPLMLLLMS